MTKTSLETYETFFNLDLYCAVSGFIRNIRISIFFAAVIKHDWIHKLNSVLTYQLVCWSMDVFNSFKKCPNNLFFADIFTCRCKQLAIYLVTFISVSTLNIYWPERNADRRCFSYFFKPRQSGKYVLCTSLYTCTLCPEKTYMFWSFKSRENVNINFLLINIIADIMISSTDFLILLI